MDWSKRVAHLKKKIQADPVRIGFNVALWAGIFVLLGVLLFRNPFSLRTLIPNFEPFPDAFHYVTTARCFLFGEGWQLCREGRYIAPAVPPMYSLTLLPFLFLHNNDPRMFYFANVGFAVLSVILLIGIGKTLHLHRFAIALCVLALILNTYFTWLPSLAMAENALLPLFLIAVWLLLLPVCRSTAVAMGVVVTSFYATKYAMLPQSVVIALAYLTKILLHTRHEKKTIYVFWVYASMFALAGLASALILIPVQTAQIINTVNQLIHSAVLKSPNVSESSETTVTGAFSFFSLQYFSTHLQQYVGLLWGRPMRLLWMHQPLASQVWAIIGSIGMGMCLLQERKRMMSVTLVGAVTAQMVFMAFFYTADARYVYTLLPTLMIGVGVFADVVFRWTEKNSTWKFTSQAAIVAGVLLILLVNRTYLKQQIGLNMKYAETPWWYLAVEHLNQVVIKDKSNDERLPVVITAMPPYLVDYYSTGAYQLLPLSHDHDFRGERVALWGKYNYDDLLKLYEEFLQEGRTVFVTNYGIGNEKPRQEDFAAVQNHFTLDLISEGCLGACNVWEVTLGERK